MSTTTAAPSGAAAPVKDDADIYFETHNPPSNLPQISRELSSFLAHHKELNNRVVLVSSGGTMVPLENQTVRFIDNFSAGTRGATSAEYFLSLGYAVIFLHRQFSLLPYSRHYSHSTNCFLDFLSEWGRIGDDDDTANSDAPNSPVDDGGDVVVRRKYRAQMLDVLRKYRRANEKKLLYLLPFTTVSSYLFYLHEVATQMQPFGSSGLFYLAAAVSDFFVPPSRMVEHKIQSGDLPDPLSEDSPAPAMTTPAVGAGRKLVIDLDPVPKFLKRLVERWAPDGMIVSFKLETDSSILLKKCHQALDRYQHNLVIGNLLSTRKHEVVFVSPNKEGRGYVDEWVRVPVAEDGEVQVEIESEIVPKVVKLHEEIIERKRRRDEENAKEEVKEA